MEKKGVLYALGAYLMWGLFPLYWKQLESISALQLIGHRIGWSFILLLIVIIGTRQWSAFRSVALAGRTLRIYLVAGLLITVNWYTYVWAVTHGFVVETSLGYYINPLFTVLLGVVILHERLRAIQWLPIGLAALGVLYLTLTYGSLPWIALILAVSFGLYGLIKKIAPLSSLHGLTIETGWMFIPALGYLVFSELAGNGAFLHSGLKADWMMVGAGLVTTVPLLLFASAAPRVSLTTIGILQYVNPTMQFLLGVLLYKEPFTHDRLIGFGLVWAGLILFWVEGSIPGGTTRPSPFPRWEKVESAVDARDAARPKRPIRADGDSVKILIIGGTGLISSACSELASARGNEVFILNRSVSQKYAPPPGATLLKGDLHGDASSLSRILRGLRFDAVVDFLAFEVVDIERDLNLFRGRAGQFVFISSASAYQKPPANFLITESTPLANPFWKYSRDKIECELRLLDAYRTEGFPVTIVRPSLTYGPSQIPFCVGSWTHPWTIIDRMLRGRRVIVPGDGTSLWVLTWNADFAEGLVGLLGDDRTIGEAFHITSDEVLTWDQIFLQACSVLDLEPRIIHVPSDLIAAYWPHAVGSLIGDKMNSVVFDNSKIKRFVPGFECNVNWAEGLTRAVAWHKSKPEFQTVDEDLNGIFDKIISAQEKAFPTHQLVQPRP